MENKENKFVVVILAAGKGKRMNSDIPKALCEINGKSMLSIILDKVTQLSPEKIIIVVGHKKEMIIESLKDYPFKEIHYVEQNPLLGTGHAVMQTYDLLHNYNNDCMIHFGDNPNIKLDTLFNILKCHKETNNNITIGTYKDDESYTRGGRIIRNKNGQINEIYEDPNIDYKSDEYLGGILIYKSPMLFSVLKNVTNNNKQNEYYLPDTIKLCDNVGNLLIDKNELINVNTKDELLLATKYS